MEDIESNSQLIGFMNEFVEIIGKNVGSRTAEELLGVVSEVLGIGKSSGLGSDSKWQG